MSVFVSEEEIGVWYCVLEQSPTLWNICSNINIYTISQHVITKGKEEDLRSEKGIEHVGFGPSYYIKMSKIGPWALGLLGSHD